MHFHEYFWSVTMPFHTKYRTKTYVQVECKITKLNGNLISQKKKMSMLSHKLQNIYYSNLYGMANVQKFLLFLRTEQHKYKRH